MPLISRGKLLAGVAAMVALSVAGPGCRTNDACRSCCSSPGEGATCQTGGCQDGNRLARLSFPIRPRIATSEPSVASSPAAIMLRPVPLGTPVDPQTGTASTWTPVQRVSGEMVAPQEADLTPVASLGSPMLSNVMTNTQAPAGGPLLSVTPVPTLAGTAADAPEEKSKAKPSTTLPMPKETGITRKAAVAMAYPDLGPALITQPMDAPREFSMRALSTYIVEPPDILRVELYLPALRRTTIVAEQLVRPDGTIGFSSFPPVFAAGLSLEQIKRRLAETILPLVSNIRGADDGKKEKEIALEDILGGLKVDVLRYNSKFYYVITDGGGYGEQVTPVPLTGNERVLDAVAKIQGLPAVASKKHIWVARATQGNHEQILPVDWCGIAQRGSAMTNFQMFPGDRLYINSDKRIRVDSWLGKTLAPVERILGVTLLGSSVVNSIKNGSNSGGGTGNNVGR